MDLKTLAAVSSFLLSLGLVIREYYKSKVRFDITYFFTGNPECNDIIALYNKSSKPLMISNIQLYKNYNRLDERELDLGIQGDFILISILPSAVYKLELSQQYKFTIFHDEQISLKIKIMGRKNHIVIPILIK